MEPRSISFKGAVQTLEAFRPVLALLGEADAASRKVLSEQLLDAIARHRVADRPTGMNRGSGNGARNTTAFSASQGPRPNAIS
jgi:hypothetical protein